MPGLLHWHLLLSTGRDSQLSVPLNSGPCAELCEDGAEAWEAAANDGSTPAALAAAVGNAEAAQAILESLQAVEEQAGDFEDDGWPVDSATGDALMVDEVSAEAMTVEEVSAETIAASGGSEEDEAVRTSIDSLDSIGSLHEVSNACYCVLLPC